ncbi:hypothetical protein P7K49_013118 [Saguinus oedipus]|uniref:ENTH domain-containing protein n=1 Tax=Saguinus oedipus TaxID=9490 RepID=A0ABQ9VF51_SAGOE|nr:hypothetical protein P7K49_013118 [Saguinus oedipus]
MTSPRWPSALHLQRGRGPPTSKSPAMTTSALRRQVKNIVHNYSEAEIKVREATSNDPWAPPHPSLLMSEIADLTFNTVAFTEVMGMLWRRLNDSGENWRHVYKALILLDYLLKTGSKWVAHQCLENLYTIQTLKDFQYIDCYGKDQGVNVREKVKQMIALLKDEERLWQERTHALKTKERMALEGIGIGSGQLGFSRCYSEDYGRSRSSPSSYNSSTSSPRCTSDLEQARPQTSGQEELQLQLALAMSREEAEKGGLLSAISRTELEREERKEKEKLKSSQSPVLDLADIFVPAPAPPSTYCSADPWDIPGLRPNKRDQCLENLYTIQTLKDFQYIDRDGKDQGVNVREKVKQVMALLKDEERLWQERTHALKTKERMALEGIGIGSGQLGFSRCYSEDYGRSRSSPSSYNSSSSSPRCSSDLEQARPQTSGQEELQLQLALAMSHEEAEKGGLLSAISRTELEREERKEKEKLKSSQSPILDLADIFVPAPARPSTYCSADPWDIPGLRPNKRDQCLENLYTIQTLKDFQYIDRDGKDQGVNVREKVKQVMALLKDEERLWQERTHALKTKERMALEGIGIGNGQLGFSRYYSEDYGRSRSSPSSYNSSTSSPRCTSDLEQARPQTSGQEELQLQLALAMSREEAEKGVRSWRGDGFWVANGAGAAVRHQQDRARERREKGEGEAKIQPVPHPGLGRHLHTCPGPALHILLCRPMGHPRS